MESAKAPENSSAVAEKFLHLPSPKVFSKSKGQISATVSAQDSQPNVSASSTQILKSGDESGKLSVGSHVVVGGVKEGILRFLGRVHFMEGDWCGVELDEPDGLHDGTVEQVRYFTCKSGHGIFAPRSKVSLMHDRKSSDQKSSFLQQARSGGDAEPQFQCERAGSLENVVSSLVGGELVQVREKSVKPSKLARPRSVVSSVDIDLKEALMQSKLPRPKSAVVSLAHAESNPDVDLRVRRSSLLDYASLAKQQRASPKRVTFGDTLEYDLLSSPHISAAKLRKSDFQGEGYNSDEGSYDSMTPHGRFDPYMALTLTYDLESSPPRKNTRAIMKPEGIKKSVEKIKITTPVDTQQLDSSQSAPEVDRLKRIISAGSVGDSNQGATEQLLRDIFDKMDEEISNIPTPDTAEIQMVFPDSLSSSEEDARRLFSSDGRSLTVSLHQKKQARPDSDRRLSKYSVSENDERSGEMRDGKGVIEDSLEENHSGEHGLRTGAAPVTSGNMGGDLQALTKKASFELARTALAQYADLIRAAQEDRTHRLAKASVKPKQQPCSAFDPSLEEPPSAEPLLEESTEGDFLDPSWSKDRTDQVKTFEDVQLSDSVDSLNVDVNESVSSVHRDGLDEYETFEGEDLRTINADVIIIDSDEEFIEGERLAAINDELDLEDSLIIDSQPLINEPFPHPAAVSEGYQDVDGNLDDPTSAPVHPEIIGQISAEDWNNTINNMRQYESEASTLLPLVQLRRKQQSRPISMVSTASSDAGIVDDLLPGYGLKHDRPISLISSTSSTDTGCPMEVDSDMLSSAVLSSTMEDLAESWQEPGSTSTTANWLKSYGEPDLQEKHKGEELLDYPVTVLPSDGNFGKALYVADVDSGVINVENDQKGLETGELCGEILLVGTGEDDIKTKLLEKEIDLTKKADEKSHEKMDSVLLKLDSDSMQKDSSADVHVDFRLPSSSCMPNSVGSSRDDQLVLSAKGLSCAEFPQELASGNPISVQVENSSKDMVSVAEEQPDVGFSSVLAKVLVSSSETPEARLVHDRDLQVYMVSEESGFTAGKLISSEDACMGDKGTSIDEVQLENKHTGVRKTESEHQGTSSDESRMEEKGDEKKPELENMGTSVKESDRKGTASFNDCQKNLFVKTTVNSEEEKVDETFSSREEIEVNELVPSSENIQLEENRFNKDEIFQEGAGNIMPDEKNGQEEGQAGQKMNRDVASVSLCKETTEGKGKEISRLENESELLCEQLIEEGFQERAVEQEPHLQKLDKEYRVDLLKEDAGNGGRRKEETAGSDGLFQDTVAKQEMMAGVSDSHSNSSFSRAMAGSGTAQEALVSDSSMITAVGIASESALSNDSLAGAAESTEAMSEVAEIDVISKIVQVSDAIKMATDNGSDILSGKAENNILSEGQETITAVTGIAEDHETVTGKGGDTVSESKEDSNTLVRLVESSDIVSEATDREKVDQRLLEQVEDTDRSVSSDVMQQPQIAIQNHETRGSSDVRRDGHEEQAVKNVILEPERSEEGNEIARMSKEITNDATGDSEVTGKVTVNLPEKRVPEKDVTDGGNAFKGVRNGHAKTPSKLMARGNVRGDVSETLGQVKTKWRKADDKRDIKDDSVVGNGKAKQKSLNVGKNTKADSDSITGKSETISGNIKLEKTASDVSKIKKDDSGAENGNARRRLPNSSRNAKSDSANTKNVTDNVKISRSQSNMDRNSKNDSDTMTGSVRSKLSAVKNQNKDPHPESPKDLKGNGKRKSASVSEPMESSTDKDLGASASESSESDDTIRDKRSANLAKLSVLQNTSAAKISGAKDGTKSKQNKQSESTSSNISDDKGKILNGHVTKDAKPQKPSIAKTGGLNTTAPAKKSGVSPTTLVPSSGRSMGRKFLSSQETLVGAKAESAQENVKTGIARKNPSHNPGSALVAQKRGSSNPGSEGKGRLSNATTIVNAVSEKKAAIPRLSKKESVKADQINDISSPRASSQQAPKATTRGGKPSVTQGSSSSNPASKKSIPKPGSAAGHTDGDRTIPKKQTKESEAAKPASKKPSAATAKDAKSKADSSSQLTLQVNELKSQLKQTQQQLEGGVKEREELQLKVAHMKEEQASEIREIRQKHQQEIDSLKKAFVEQTKTEVEKVIDQHSHEVRTLKSYHDRHLSEAKQEHRTALEAREKEFQDAIAKLKAEHLKELNETKASHEQQLNEISERFEEIKISLSSKVEQLRSKCDELCSRELCYKDTCKRETDLREQAALEVDSLRVVLEQRNGEIRKLRQQNALLDEKVQEIPVLKERITKLQQSIENLEAVNDLKSGHEKQLADMHQVLLRKFERESKAMKRLSMENEELMWRLSQSDFGPSCLQEKFPPGMSDVSLMSRSYDSQQAATMTRRTRSNTDANQEATMSRSYDGFSDFYASTPKAVSSREAGLQSAHSLSSSSSTSGSSHSQRVKLRRSGTYEVMDQENFEHKP